MTNFTDHMATIVYALLVFIVVVNASTFKWEFCGKVNCVHCLFLDGTTGHMQLTNITVTPDPLIVNCI